MRRGGYFASVSGAGAASAARVLRPPRRLFAPDPPLARWAPPPDVAGPPAERAAPAPQQSPPAPRPRHEPQRPVAQELPVPPIRRQPAPRVRWLVPSEPAPLLSPAGREPESARDAPAAPLPVEAERVESDASTPPVVPAVAAARTPAPARRRGPVAEPVRAEPVARIEPPRTVPPPPAATRRGRAPGLRIGTIEVTVVSPPPPAPQQVPQQPRPAAVHRPRPVRGPDRPAPFFGLAQR